MPKSEGAVVGALISSFSDNDPMLQQVLVVSETEAFPTSASAAREDLWTPFEGDPRAAIVSLVPEAPEALVDHFLAVLGTHSTVKIPRDSLRSGIAVQYVKREHIDHLFQARDGGWRTLRKEYPGTHGYWRISRVGILDDRHEALIYYSFTCGGTCGMGKLALLSRQGNAWKIIKSYDLWNS